MTIATPRASAGDARIGGLSRAAWALAAVWSVLAGPAAADGPRADHAALSIPIASNASLLHLGSIDSFDITPGRVEAAQYVLQVVEGKRPEPARAALEVYRRIIPNQNFGGEYTALEWFCQYLLASAAEQSQTLAAPFVASYFHFFADRDYATLREYLKRKYKIEKIGDEGTPKAHRRLGFPEDFILFNNPRRQRWERSRKMIEVLGLKPGNTVADVGCGPGYFTFQFAKLVGPQGRVFANDTNELHTKYVAGLAKQWGVSNIRTVKWKTRRSPITAPISRRS